MARKKKGKAAPKRGKKKVDASKIRMRDLDPKKGNVTGGGFGGLGGFGAITRR